MPAMRAFYGVLAVLAILLVVIPLGVFFGMLAVQGFTQAAVWASIYLLIWCVLLAVIGLAVLGALVVFGLPFVRRKARSLLYFVQSASNRVERLASGVGGVAVKPVVWGYGLVAWARGFVHGLSAPKRV